MTTGADLREQLAELAHEQWTGWMRHLYSKCQTSGNGDYMLIPKLWWTRWLRQMDTRFGDLSDAEKESDRKEADRVLALLVEGTPPEGAQVNRQPLPDHDNHHNALACPYCNPDGLVLAAPSSPSIPSEQEKV